MDERTPSQPELPRNPPRVRPWYRRAELLLLIAVVLAIYLPRLTAIPVCGEESRWATVARGMLESGDWLVPRQQGQVFPDRPPLGIWPIAAIGSLRGEIDAVAIRLPSVVAITLTSVLIFAYGSLFLSRAATLLTALLYPTMGQVLQLGGLGESDAQFTFYIASSLLLWHMIYTFGRRPIGRSIWMLWPTGYALAAAGALVKGMQAPVYFAAVTFVFLALRRDWKTLLSWQHAAGIGVFFAILGAWQIPYILATDLPTGLAMWTNGPTKRFMLKGLLEHLATYPLETFACLLPWSPLLLFFLHRAFRGQLETQRPYMTFLLTATLVCYPSLWFAATARGRYFMPLYPCVALLIGVVVHRLLQAAPNVEINIPWRRYATAMAIIPPLAGFAIALAATDNFPRLAPATQPLLITVCFSIVAALVCATLCYSVWDPSTRSITASIVSLMLLLAVGMKVVVTNVNVNEANDLSVPVAAIKQQLPADGRLVSFTAVNHRFDHYYGGAIEELPWPDSLAEVPAGVEYFCFDRNPGDTPERRTAGRFWNEYTTSGTLPFYWEEIATVSMARRKNDDSQAVVIVGRIVRHEPLAESAKHVTLRITALTPALSQRETD